MVSNLNYIELFDFIGELSKTSIGHFISPLFNLLDSSKKVVDDFRMILHSTVSLKSENDKMFTRSGEK